MTLKHLCLVLLAVIAFAVAQNESEFNIPSENDNQFPPDKNSEPEGILLSPSELFDDVKTQSSIQQGDNENISIIEDLNPTTEALNADTTTETSIPSGGETQLSTTQEYATTTEDPISRELAHAIVDAVEELVATEISTLSKLDDDVITEDAISTEPNVTQSEEQQITVSVDASTTEPSLTGEEVQTLMTESVVASTTEPSVTGEEVQTLITELVDEEQQKTVSVDASTTESSVTGEVVQTLMTESVDASTTEPSVTGEEVQTLMIESVDASTTEPSVADKEVQTLSTESVDASTTEPSVIDEEVQTLITEPVDASTTEFSVTVEEVQISTTEPSATSLDENVELPTTELGRKGETVVDSLSESVIDITTQSSVPLVTDVKLATETSAISLEQSIITKNTGNNLLSTQTNEESHNDGTTASALDPSDFAISLFSLVSSGVPSNNSDIQGISPLTLPEAPKEVEATQEVRATKEITADNKEALDVSVGATTSINKAGGIDKSVIGVIIAGMVVVVAGITIKKNWKSIKNKFSSSPRPANDRTNHTNGIAPEEMPLQVKDNKNPSPV